MAKLLSLQKNIREILDRYFEAYPNCEYKELLTLSRVELESNVTRIEKFHMDLINYIEKLVKDSNGDAKEIARLRRTRSQDLNSVLEFQSLFYTYVAISQEAKVESANGEIKRPPEGNNEFTRRMF